MAHAGQEIVGQDGFRLLIVRLEEELLEMEATYGGTAPMPPAHLHPRQDERFEVLEGTMRAIVGGEERRYEAGDTIDVPAGTPHQMAADGPARTRWEVRPALRTAEFFETLFGGTAGPDFLDRFADEFQLSG